MKLSDYEEHRKMILLALAELALSALTTNPRSGKLPAIMIGKDCLCLRTSKRRMLIASSKPMEPCDDRQRADGPLA